MFTLFLEGNIPIQLFRWSWCPWDKNPFLGVITSFCEYWDVFPTTQDFALSGYFRSFSQHNVPIYSFTLGVINIVIFVYFTTFIKAMESFSDIKTVH